MFHLSTSIHQKSDENANTFRESGNEAYKKNEYFEALTFYNISITYANSKKVISLGYANRSAVYLTLGYYNECLKNIELARKNDYPADKLANLKEREEKCKKFMLEGKKNIAEDPWNFFKLSYPANEKIPWIVNCLEVKTTQKYGRGIYATKDLKAGDIISIEEPFLRLKSDNLFYYHCNNCFNTDMLNLIPCSKTASMMFCSTDCMNKYYSKTIDMNVALNIDMMMLSEVSASFGGYKNLDDFINKTDLKDLTKTIFDFEFSNPEDPNYKKNLAICFLSLSSSKNLSDLFKSTNIQKYVSKKTAYHILSLYLINLSKEFYSDGRIESIFMNNNISLFKSLMNHACTPNVCFVSIENKIVGLVVRPIKAGEQLFNCYYIKSPEAHNINKNFVFAVNGFKCDCRICTHNDTSDKIWANPKFLMNRYYFEKAKRLLKTDWHILNSRSEGEEIDYEMEVFSILNAFGYYATFPC